jgi:hypothetical protein
VPIGDRDENASSYAWHEDWKVVVMDEPTSTEVALAAVDALLLVVDQSARDLREFHDVVAQARRSPLPPFPRATVLVTQRIVDKLTTVESELEEVLIGLGIARPVPPRS